MKIFSKKRALSFLMCYVTVATAVYVVSMWLASDIHIKQYLTVESRQVIIQDGGRDFSGHAQQSEVGVRLQTNVETRKGGKSISNTEGPKYSLKIMTAMKTMQQKAETLKKQEIKSVKSRDSEKPKKRPTTPRPKPKTTTVRTKLKENQKGKENVGKQGKAEDGKKNGNGKKNERKEKNEKKNAQNVKKVQAKKDETKPKDTVQGKTDPKKDNQQTNPPQKPQPLQKPQIPVPELIYGLFRQPRIDSLNTEVQIPHIVHQTWKETLLPLSLKPLLQSWKKHNPSWQYWFWTDADARLLVQTKYPDLLEMYDKFEKPVQRADVIRYFILYEFGGIYADLDVEALRPLDNFTKPHHCIISNEPLLHTYLIWKRERLPCNAFMASVPKHPFFKFLISRLPVYDRRTRRGEVMLKTGPLMLDVAMGEYERSYVKREKDITPNDKCYLAPPDEAMPSFDPAARGWFIFQCRRRERVQQRWRHVCDKLIRRKFQDSPIPKTAYANHRWMHSWTSSHKPFDKKYRPKLTSSIHNIVDNVTIPSDKILEQPEENFTKQGKS